MVPLLPSPDEDEENDDDGEDRSYPFNKEVVVDIEEDDDNGCTSWSFSAVLDGSGKNKKELVSFLSAELVFAEAVKKSPPVIQIR
jgi:hypothetical protein